MFCSVGLNCGDAKKLSMLLGVRVSLNDTAL